MRELMAQMQSQGGFPIPPYAPHEHYQQEDEVQSHRAASPEYGISPAEPRPSQQQAQQPRTRPQPPPPMPQQPERRHENAPRTIPHRSRPQRREEEARNRPGPFHQQPRYEAEDYDSDEQQRSCDLDDNDENLPFSRELRNAQEQGKQRPPPPQRQRGRGPTSYLMDCQMNRSGNENSGQALATTTLNAVPTLAYEDVNPTTDPHQMEAQQGPRRGRGRSRGFAPRNRSNPNFPGYCLHHRSYGHDTADCRDYAHRSRQKLARERHNSPQANRPPPR
ncbi:activating signal cointegrator 1 complex subunit 2 homolog [Olea europaea var. sylvestris]|uniref:activating signal cointegrator 1 complex subunit 2 homolog n=1 Tax=Olea europaea var. sylvestris TaxID=158386 RepID=UPI000C1D6443|nr:activating signal cointegrator 1 complex subunit 2 homolog [Olea europaea var. sylvestris]